MTNLREETRCQHCDKETVTNSDGDCRYCGELKEQPGASLREQLRKLTSFKAQNVPEAKYGFWAHLPEENTDAILALIQKSNKELLERVNKEVIGSDVDLPNSIMPKHGQTMQNKLKRQQRQALDKLEKEL